MGYNALGIVFGPLLVGNLIDGYSLRVSDPSAGLVLLPVTPPRSRKERLKQRRKQVSGHDRRSREKSKDRVKHEQDQDTDPSSFTVNKIHIANSVTEMLIVHWREVVRQMRNIGAIKAKRDTRQDRSSAIDVSTFGVMLSRDANKPENVSPTTSVEHSNSGTELENPLHYKTSAVAASRRPSSESSQHRFSRVVPSLLSPTKEESPSNHAKPPKDVNPPDILAGRSAGSDHPTKANECLAKTSTREISPPRSNASDRVGEKRGTELGHTIAQDHPMTENEKNGPSSPGVLQRPRLATSRSDTALRQLSGAGDSEAFSITPRSKSAIGLQLPHQPLPRNHDGEGYGYFPISKLKPNFGRTVSRSRSPGETRPMSPSSQWKSILASSNTSMESLVKSSRERRLRRSCGSAQSPTTGEPAVANRKSTTPEWKEQLGRRSEPKTKTMLIQREPEMAPGQTSQSTESSHRATGLPTGYGATPSRTGASTGSPYKDTPRRSFSKPIPGAVKAMTAFFDNPAMKTPAKGEAASDTILADNPKRSKSFPSHMAGHQSSTRPHPGQGYLVHTNMDRGGDSKSEKGRSGSDKVIPTAEIMPSNGTVRYTPTRPPQRTTTWSTRGVPQLSRSKTVRQRERSQPPRLGTIVPYQEEPPVGHFIRPRSATSMQRRQTGTNATTPPIFDLGPASSSRDSSGNGNSFLHAQIRNLQRQLEIRNEEILHLRRQLEAQEHASKDIGTLCESLRAAKRECSMWRKRAEGAERRMAVFQRFASRLNSLGGEELDDDDDDDDDDEVVGVGGEEDVGVGVGDVDGIREYDDGSLRYRGGIHDGMNTSTGKRGTSAGYSSSMEDSSGIGEGSSCGVEVEVRGRTTRLWKTARELFDIHGVVREERKTVM
ncbi:hypothetical protein GGS20DRAFT_533862 [Poronia punctata]|nr:hypothetical protein GGS20DRAFT_533862 [Poronia punctata]